MIHSPPYNKNELKIESEVCVIGSGAGGGVCAQRLTEKGLKVVLVEEGLHYEEKDFSTDLFSSLKHLYRNKGFQFSMGNSPFPILTGKCLGGTTVVNSAICIIPPPELLEHWMKTFLLPTISPESMLSHFKRIEKEIKIAPGNREVLGKNNLVFERGLKRLNWRGSIIKRNAPECEGCGTCNFGCPVGAKISVDKAYIKDAVAKGAQVYTGVRIHRLNTKGKKVTTAEGVLLDGEENITGRVNIKANLFVLAGGAIMSPLILINSDIKTSPHIGKNLHVHPACGILALFSEKIMGWHGIPQGYHCSEFINEGILIETAFFDPGIIAGMIPMFQKDSESALKNMDSIGIAGAMIKDPPLGYVKIMRHRFAPEIHYTITPTLKRKILRGFFLTAKLMFAAGAKKVKPSIKGAPFFSDLNALEMYLEKVRTGEIQIEGNHPLGTLRMGLSPEISVVSPEGKVHGLENLFVIDASILPTSPGINPMVLIMALASRLSEEAIKENRNPRKW